MESGNRKQTSVKIALAVAIGIFLVSLVFVAWNMLKNGKEASGKTVRVTQDGKVLYTFNLEKEADCEYVITTAGGGTNTISIRNGTICVSQADCPDQICVRTGILRSEGEPIVCLPHHLMIQFEK